MVSTCCSGSGVMGPPVDQVTTDGFDLQFGTNVVGEFAFAVARSELQTDQILVTQGHFLFTELLMPALFAAAQNSPDHHARVITTSSSAALCGHIDFASIRDGPARRRYSKEALYAQSKLVRSVVGCPSASAELMSERARQTSSLLAKLRGGMPIGGSSPSLLTQASTELLFVPPSLIVHEQGVSILTCCGTTNKHMASKAQ